MADDSPTSVTSAPETLSTASKLFTVGAELIQEVQSHIGSSKVRSLRLTLGGRTIKDFPVSPATAIASVLVVIAAVVVSNLRLEVMKETDVKGDTAKAAPGTGNPGGTP